MAAVGGDACRVGDEAFPKERVYQITAANRHTANSSGQGILPSQATTVPLKARCSKRCAEFVPKKSPAPVSTFGAARVPR
jgi:hypothetical protein